MTMIALFLDQMRDAWFAKDVDDVSIRALAAAAAVVVVVVVVVVAVAKRLLLLLFFTWR
jgi:hypothetical protein